MLEAKNLFSSVFRVSVSRIKEVRCITQTATITGLSVKDKWLLSEKVRPVIIDLSRGSNFEGYLVPFKEHMSSAPQTDRASAWMFPIMGILQLH